MVRRVLVLGATGHIGRQLAEACLARGTEVVGTSRRGRGGHEAVDLTDPASFDRFDGYDVVVNATDTAVVPPVPMAAHCLARGIVFVETSADPAVFLGLKELGDGPGAVVLGAGAFPGLSTYLLERAPREAVLLELVATWSVLSGAGRGTVGVMVDGLSRPALVVRDRQLAELPPLSAPARFRIAGRDRWAVPLAMPDVVLAPVACSARDVTFWAAVRPSVPGPVLRVLGALARRGWFRNRVVAALVRAQLSVIRRGLFARATTPLRIELRVDGEVRAAFEADDAFAAGAHCVAVLAERWPTSVRGVVLPWRGVPLDEMRRALEGVVRFE